MKWNSVVLGLYLLGSVTAGIVLAEGSLHLPRRPLRAHAQVEEIVQTEFHSHVEDVSVTANDRATLKGWYVRPQQVNGATVILLHGVTDNRLGVAGYARMFLKHGYAVLLPDARAHGESGGDLATYGLIERYDLLQWSKWVRQRSPGCVYLFGESMGAAIALETTAVDPRLCAVVVESPYSQFREIAYDRVAQHAHVSPWIVKTIGQPMLESSLIYARLRYKIDLTQASPEDALEQSSVPTLLIHGTADGNIPIHHSYELMRTCASHAQLWVVEGADHGGAVNVNPQEFERRVVGWFEDHRASL